MNKLYLVRHDYASKDWLHPEREEVSPLVVAMWCVIWCGLMAFGIWMLHAN